MANDGGLAAFEKHLKLIAKAPEAIIDRALLRSAKRVAAKQKTRAPEDTGALRDSIEITVPGQSTPPFSQPGGMHIAREHEVLITAGNEDVRYPHLVEFGTSDTEAQPFFLNTFHEERVKEQRLIKRAAMKAIRQAAAGKSITDD